MMEAGRIKHHIANNVSNPKNTLLAVGYCSPLTLGGKLLNGEKKVNIFGEEHEVNARIERIEAFSGHADYEEMIDYLECQDKTKIKKVFLVHGESSALEFYAKKLEEKGYSGVVIPSPGEEFRI
jgi:metallo-beta-lactamase family protein